MAGVSLKLYLLKINQNCLRINNPELWTDQQTWKLTEKINLPATYLESAAVNLHPYKQSSSCFSSKTDMPSLWPNAIASCPISI